MALSNLQGIKVRRCECHPFSHKNGQSRSFRPAQQCKITPPLQNFSLVQLLMTIKCTWVNAAKSAKGGRACLHCTLPHFSLMLPWSATHFMLLPFLFPVLSFWKRTLRACVLVLLWDKKALFTETRGDSLIRHNNCLLDNLERQSQRWLI